jgi:hypothetical protein
VCACDFGTLCRETQADEDYQENLPEEPEPFYARESDSGA